ncbi:MAG: TSUP family transporter, partial [Candidatus Fonsibacter sp.]
LVALPKTAPAELLGTNKLPSFLGTASATASYLRRLRPDFRIAIAMALPAFIGAALGATVAVAAPAVKQLFIVVVGAGPPSTCLLLLLIWPAHHHVPREREWAAAVSVLTTQRPMS